jgi:catechol 2,3-dioxygenase-like lactoylglutathione lyase family enzyme
LSYQLASANIAVRAFIGDGANMPLNQLIGIDHAVVAVRNLEAAADSWRGLGFTISPPGTHSPHLGTGNYTIMFGDDYIELLGILGETQHNAPTRDFLTEREGLERVALTALNAATVAEELRARGIAVLGPIEFSRPVDLPNGCKSEARFRVMQWPVEEQPAGIRIFVCQHLTPDAVWIKTLRVHSNTARRLVEVELLSENPHVAAAHMSRLIGRPTEALADGAVRICSGNARADFVFLDLATLEQRHPGISFAGLPREGGVGLRIAVADAAAAAKMVGSIGAVCKKTVTVPPSAANGVIVTFDE